MALLPAARERGRRQDAVRPGDAARGTLNRAARRHCRSKLIWVNQLRVSEGLTIFVSALEPSADAHAAAVVAAIRRREPAASVIGLGGPQMQQAGCRLVADLTHRSAMLLGSLRLVTEAVGLLQRIDRILAGGSVQVVVPVDSPTFNLPLARRAKARGLPVIYFIAPQVWAWAEFRVRKVRARVDQLACILPFEESYFRARGIPAWYVGHPLMEALSARPLNLRRIQRYRSLGKPLVACFPGSRRHVVAEVLPGQIEVCARVREAFPEAAFLFAAASEKAGGQISEGLRRRPSRLNARIELGANSDVITAADLVLVASGTASLEVAWHRRPMIVMYNASKWGYRLIGRWLIRTPHLSLVNILAGRRIVPEFMPYYESAEPIAAEAIGLLRDPERREAMIRDLGDLVAGLGGHQVADEVAAMVLDAAQRTCRRLPGPRGSRHCLW